MAAANNDDISGGQTMTKFAVLGAGNLAQATAAQLALAGCDVTMSNRTAAKLDGIVEQDNTIEVFGPIDECNGVAKLSVVSGDFESVLRDRDVTILCVPANGHAMLIRAIAPYITPTHHIILHPGQMFGALGAHKILKEHDPALTTVTVSEIESSLFTCRAERVGQVEVFAIKNHLGFATFPSTRHAEVVGKLPPMFRAHLHARPNVLATSLMDLNMIAHPIITLMNAGEIERGHRFLYYMEGVTKHIGTLLDAADAERLAVARELGLDIPSLKNWVLDEYAVRGAHGSSAYEVIVSNHAFDTITAPAELFTRYIWEDIPLGVIPLMELAASAKVLVPTFAAVYTLLCTMFEQDFRAEARTLGGLGLDHLSVAQLQEYVTTGEDPPSPPSPPQV